METIRRNEQDWMDWFESQRVTPLHLVYEDAVADMQGTIQRVIEFMAVEDDERRNIHLPMVEQQSDGTNKEWIARYKREAKTSRSSPQERNVETRNRAKIVGVNAKSANSNQTERKGRENSAFFDRYDRFLDNLPTAGSEPGLEYVAQLRMRHRYEAIIAQNRDLLQGSRVLDLMSADGRWSMAALDAGAISVVGVELSGRRVAMANDIFTSYGIDPATYEFVNSDVFSALAEFAPESFDVVLCTQLLELLDPHQFLRQISSLSPKHVIIETDIAFGKGPISRFNIRLPDPALPSTARHDPMLMARPSHELIVFMCECFNFGWQFVDWQELGIAHWTGIHDYERGRRRTYVLDRI
jgi:2-polyprenyl-3-methyl-5-hydroxy-6-metoxy-1,4-benzoquinol methylase